MGGINVQNSDVFHHSALNIFLEHLVFSKFDFEVTFDLKPPSKFQFQKKLDVNGSNNDHYEEQEKEWRSEKEAAKIYIAEEI